MRLLKAGLFLIAIWYWSSSYALSPPIGESGTCYFQPKIHTQRTVCTKGNKGYTYWIERQNLSMDYFQQRDEPFQKKSSASKNKIPKMPGFIEEAPDQIGPGNPRYCYKDGFVIDFCGVYKRYKSSFGIRNKKNIFDHGRVGIKEMIFSHYDKWNRETCWSADKQSKTTAGAGRTKDPDKCRKALYEEIAKQEKAGWECAIIDMPGPPVVPPPELAPPPSNRPVPSPATGREKGRE